MIRICYSHWSILVGIWRETAQISKKAEPSMKLMTPEIVWHSKEPVFSADFHRRGANWRLATGGADNDIKVTRNVEITLPIHTVESCTCVAEVFLLKFC